MKGSLLILLALCASACMEGRSPYMRVKMHDAPELRFSGGFTAQINDSARHAAVHVTYRGRAIRYEGGALYVDEQRLALPADARVVAFDGPNIYVDGRSVASR